MKQICVIGCKHTTRDLIISLIQFGFKIDSCITITSVLAEREKVAGYYDLKDVCNENNIHLYYAESYKLSTAADIAQIRDLKIDIALVMGWQRLIPDSVLHSFTIGAFGMHGASKPLPYGRGRSPMNWSIIQGKKVFYTHMIKYHAGVDDGPVVAFHKFNITPFDNCLTLHFKNTLAMIKLCQQYLPKLLKGEVQLIEQERTKASYYPKRTAADGLINWQDKTAQLYNFIRAITDPFPGAYSFINNDPNLKIVLWQAIPFDSSFTYDGAQQGQIVEVFFDGSFVIKTIDATLLVTKYQSPIVPMKNMILGCASIPIKKWGKLPQKLKAI